MERVLGTPALFATAYGNVGSSIYYALGLTAVYALGLTPLVFVVAGVVFAATAATYAEGTARFPEAGGSASFSRHAFDELVSFTAGWAQMLVYIVTVAVSAFFVPHYLSIFWEPLNTNPWDIVVGAIVIVILVTLNVVGVQEAAKLSISLAVVDFATQVLLVIVGFALVLSPEVLVDNVHWGVAPTWSNLAIAIPVAMLAYTGVETVSNLAEEARDPVRTVPNSYKLVAGAVFAIYFTLPLVALSALPVERIDGQLTTLLALPPEDGGYANDPILGVVENIGLEGRLLDAARDLRGHPRSDDPLHRDERGRHRRLAHHLLDGDLSAAAGGVSPAAPAVQDAVAVARALRGDRADPRDPPRRRQLRRDALLARRDPVVHGRPRIGHPPAGDGRARGRDSVPRAAERADRRGGLADLRLRRRYRHRDLLPRPRRSEPPHALGRAGVDARGSGGVRRVPAAHPAPPAA